MADTLEIFGVEYTNVAGIIATTPNETDLTYIRPQGTKSISTNGTGIDVAEYASVDVNVSAPSPSLQSKTKIYTPTETAQTESVTADSGYDGLDTVSISVGAISNTYVGTGITRRSSTDLTASGATVIVPSGYYSEQESKAVASGTEGTPTATKGTVSNHQISVTPSVTNTAGYISGGTKTGTAVTVSASELVSGTYTVDSSGTKDVTNYASASVPAGTAGTPSASKGVVSNHSVSVTPSVTNTTGWITGSTKAGTAVTVTASELANGNKSITENGTDIDVVGYSTVSVNVPSSSPTIQSLSITPTTSQQTFNASDVDGYKPVTIAAMPTMMLPTTAASSATSGYTSKATIGRSTAAQYINIPPGYNSDGAYYVISAVVNGSATGPTSLSGSSATITTGTNTITLTKTDVSTTPTVSAGYVSSATASTATVTLTASVTVNPTPTASGATVTIPAGYYSSQTTKSVTSGSATAPASISGTAASVSTGTNTLTLTKTVSVTPTVSAGYVSSGTAGNSSVSLTASVTTKAAATITPTTTNQTIASGTYLTGTQTIAGDADLVGGNILSTANIFGVQGTVVVQNYYTGSSAPSSSLGSNGDLYLQS